MARTARAKGEKVLDQLVRQVALFSSGRFREADINVDVNPVEAGYMESIGLLAFGICVENRYKIKTPERLVMNGLTLRELAEICSARSAKKG